MSGPMHEVICTDEYIFVTLEIRSMQEERLDNFPRVSIEYIEHGKCFSPTLLYKTANVTDITEYAHIFWRIYPSILTGALTFQVICDPMEAKWALI